eukprot:gene475-1883_t
MRNIKNSHANQSSCGRVRSASVSNSRIAQQRVQPYYSSKPVRSGLQVKRLPSRLARGLKQVAFIKLLQVALSWFQKHKLACKRASARQNTALLDILSTRFFNTITPTMNAIALLALMAACLVFEATAMKCTGGYEKVTKFPNTEFDDHGNHTYDMCREACTNEDCCNGYSWTKIRPYRLEDQDMPESMCENSMVMSMGYLYDYYCWNSPSRLALDGTNADSEVPEHSVQCLLENPCQASGYFITNLADNGNYSQTMDLTMDSTPLLVEFLKVLGIARINVFVTVWGEMVDGQLHVYKIQDAVRTGECHKYPDAIKPRGDTVMRGTTMCANFVSEAGKRVKQLASSWSQEPGVRLHSITLGYTSRRGSRRSAQSQAEKQKRLMSAARSDDLLLLFLSSCGMQSPIALSGFQEHELVFKRANARPNTTLLNTLSSRFFNTITSTMNAFALLALMAACLVFEATAMKCTGGYEKVTKFPNTEFDDHGNHTYDMCREACTDEDCCKGYSWTKIRPLRLEDQDMPESLCEDSMIMSMGYLYDHFCFNAPDRLAVDGTNADSEVPEHSVKCMLLDRCQASGYFITNLDNDGNYSQTMDLTMDSTPLLVEFLEALGAARINVLVTVWGEMIDGLLQVYKVQDAVRTGECHKYPEAIKPRGETVMRGTTMCVKKSANHL